MSTLKAKLQDVMKTAMKSGDKDTVLYARNFHAVIRKKEIDEKIDLDDASVQKIAQSSIKQRQDSITQFKAGGRDDLVVKEEAELKFLQTFLPAQMSEEELKKIIAESISEAQATTAKDMGKVMKIVQPKIQGRADNGRVSTIIKSLLP